MAIFLLGELLDQLQQRLFAVEFRFWRAAVQQGVDRIGAGVDTQQKFFV